MLVSNGRHNNQTSPSIQILVALARESSHPLALVFCLPLKIGIYSFRVATNAALIRLRLNYRSGKIYKTSCFMYSTKQVADSDRESFTEICLELSVEDENRVRLKRKLKLIGEISLFFHKVEQKGDVAR